MGLSCGFLSPTADKGYITSADNTRSGCRQTWAQTRADAGEFRAHPGLATRFPSVPTTVVALLGASICVSWPKVGPQAPSTFYNMRCPWCSSFLGNMLEMIKSLESHRTPAEWETTVEQDVMVLLLLLTSENHWTQKRTYSVDKESLFT